MTLFHFSKNERYLVTDISSMVTLATLLVEMG